MNLGDLEFKAENFKDLHGDETPWNDEKNECDVIERSELAANIANALLREKLAKAPEVFKDESAVNYWSENSGPTWCKRFEKWLRPKIRARLACLEDLHAEKKG